MALNNLAAGAIATAIRYMKSSNPQIGLDSALEFGNQRLHVNKQQIKCMETMLNIKINLPSEPREFIKSTPIFFTQLGFHSYLAIDMNKKMGAMPMDLNKSITEYYNYRKRHNLVIDSGTGEHIFNQYMVFKNQHDLCAKGGLILNLKPFFPFINHGFYSLHPVIFRDLAYANNYKQVFAFIGGAHGEYIDMTGDDRLWVEQPRTYPFWERPKSYLEECLYDKLLKRNNVCIVTCYQKTSNEEFKVPLQGKWVHNISDDKLYNEYGNQPDTFKKYHS